MVSVAAVIIGCASDWVPTSPDVGISGPQMPDPLPALPAEPDPVDAEDITWVVNTDEESGLVSYTLRWPKDYMPVTVRGGSEDLVYRRKWLISLPEKIAITQIWTFMGLDRGDLVEMDVEIDTEHGVPLVRRSLHKETYVVYDAWEVKEISTPVRAQALNVGLLGRVTGINWASKLQARCHWGIRIVGVIEVEVVEEE